MIQRTARAISSRIRRVEIAITKSETEESDGKFLDSVELKEFWLQVAVLDAIADKVAREYERTTANKFADIKDDIDSTPKK